MTLKNTFTHTFSWKNERLDENRQSPEGASRDGQTSAEEKQRIQTGSLVH